VVGVYRDRLAGCCAWHEVTDSRRSGHDLACQQPPYIDHLILTYHDRLTELRQRCVLFERERSHKVSDQPVLPQPLLQPLRVRVRCCSRRSSAPMNRMPWVDSLVVQRFLRAPRRAASEWMSTCVCVSVERSAEVVHTLCWTIFLAESSNIVCFLSVSTVRVQ
jgi:hypothetical protein